MTCNIQNKVSYKKLKKTDRIKGFKAFSKIFSNSKSFSTSLLTGYLNFEDKKIKKESKSQDIKNPLFENNIKVGFIVSKKKIRKAVHRNRIKRILKESFRQNQSILMCEKDIKANLIIGFNDAGLNIYREQLKMKTQDISDEMINLLNSVKEKGLNRY